MTNKEPDYRLLAILMILVFIIFLMVGCTPETAPQVTERARQTQYQVKFIGNDALLFRNGKIVERKASGIFTNDTVRTEIKTTTERY